MTSREGGDGVGVRGKNERRWDQYGQFRALAFSEGWVMYRRMGAMTRAMTIKEWDALARTPIPPNPKSPDGER